MIAVYCSWSMVRDLSNAGAEVTIETARLKLTPATVALARAEIGDRAEFARLLRASVPDNWPPETTVDALPLFWPEHRSDETNDISIGETDACTDVVSLTGKPVDQSRDDSICNVADMDVIAYRATVAEDMQRLAAHRRFHRGCYEPTTGSTFTPDSVCISGPHGNNR